jgi:hypothetical protein
MCSPLPCAIDSRRAMAYGRLVPDGAGRERRSDDRHHRPRVGAGIDALPGWQHAFCREVRQRTTPPTRRSPGPSSGPTAPASSWRAAFLYDWGIVPGPEGDYHRRPCQQDRPHHGHRYGEVVTAPALIAMFRPIIVSDRAGGWCELKRRADRGDRERLVSALAGRWSYHRGPGRRAGLLLGG